MLTISDEFKIYRQHSRLDLTPPKTRLEGMYLVLEDTGHTFKSLFSFNCNVCLLDQSGKIVYLNQHTVESTYRIALLVAKVLVSKANSLNAARLGILKSFKLFNESCLIKNIAFHYMGYFIPTLYGLKLKKVLNRVQYLRVR